VTFEESFPGAAIRLRADLIAAYGPTVGSDPAAEAFACVWVCTACVATGAVSRRVLRRAG